MGAQADPKIFKTLPQMFKEHGYNTTGAGKIFHGGGPSGGKGCKLHTRNPQCDTQGCISVYCLCISGCGGYDMPYSWSEPYWDCDQFWNQTVQSPHSIGWPYGSGDNPRNVVFLLKNDEIDAENDDFHIRK